jgi:hypothetical protein
MAASIVERAGEARTSERDSSVILYVSQLRTGPFGMFAHVAPTSSSRSLHPHPRKRLPLEHERKRASRAAA